MTNMKIVDIYNRLNQENEIVEENRQLTYHVISKNQSVVISLH